MILYCQPVSSADIEDERCFYCVADRETVIEKAYFSEVPHSSWVILEFSIHNKLQQGVRLCLTQFLLSGGPALFICGFWSVFQKKSLKVSGGIVSQAPLGRSHCPAQEASPAHRYRMTRLYMQLPIDGSEAKQKPNIQNRCYLWWILHCEFCLTELKQQVHHHHFTSLVWKIRQYGPAGELWHSSVFYYFSMKITNE